MPSIATLKKAQTDPQLADEGVWHEFVVPDDEPLRLKQRAEWCDKVRAWDMRRMRDDRAYYANDNLPPMEVVKKNEVDKLAEVLVTDWNVTENGVAVACTVEAVRAAMSELHDTRLEALAASGKRERYRRETVAGLEKNSARSSQPTLVSGAEAS